MSEAGSSTSSLAAEALHDGMWPVKTSSTWELSSPVWRHCDM